ncbi:baculoviral IAP repeat-containing protein 6 isoform X4 [Thrips palmi]|uniref:Dual E2 ubiquitin-conjugating enzyme/E3 ubiquitin-protein ligase BIRC6 n=1 Tax=Thrips palmi TaxID=161013 RepID=A0A6P8YQP5_THRPL|nr:baculoviral IAP repeat-containing protein 6 isoform X4 [Thrips palmi]
MADEEPWILSEDGFLNAAADSKSVICHPNLNVILLVTKSNELIVIDVNSGSILQRSSLSANWQGDVQGAYLPGTDKLLLTDGSAVGVRSDYNGVLLLDTILQTPVQKSDDVVRLELLHTEAVLLQRCLKQVELRGVYQANEVLQELSSRTKEAQANPRKTIKSQKWNTVCLELPHSALKAVCSGLVGELKRQTQHLPVLPLASALNERLNSLLPSLALDNVGTPAERNLMHSEAARRETFSKWPHMNYKWALPDQMAQAGFFHQPNSAGDDRAMCFTCIVCLVCWEPTDEPWSEHERHSPSCPFVRGEYTQNVPLSVTYATAPAAPLSNTNFSDQTTDSEPEQLVLGNSNVPELAVSFTSSGLVNVWNVKRQLKSDVEILVTGTEGKLLRAHLEEQEFLVHNRKPRPNKTQRTEENTDVQVDDSKAERDQTDCDLYADVPKPPREAWLRADTNSEPANSTGNILDSPSEGFLPKDKIVDVSAACAATTCTSKKSGSAVQPVAVVGVDFVSFFNCPRKDPPTWGGSIDVRLMNDANQASNCESGSLDIMKVSQDPSLACSSSHDEYSRGRSAFLVLYDLYPSETFVDCEDDDGENSGESYGSPTHSMSGASGAAGAETGTSGFAGPGNGSGSNGGGEKKQEKNLTTHAGGNVKKYVSGTGTSASSSSGTRQESSMYQDLFLPKFLYGPPIVQDGEGSVIISTGEADPLENLDFSPPSSVFTSPDYALNMLQVTLGNSHPGTTINHMKKIITKKCIPAPPPIIAQEPPKSKPFEPVVGQVVRMPEGYRIHSIHPTKDGGHLLVVLVYKFVGDSTACDDTTAMDVDEEEDCYGMESTAPCRLLLFPLYLEDDVIRICEVPKVYTKFSNPGEIPVEVSLLPLQERDERSDPDENESVGILAKQSHGLATLICANGTLRVIELNTLSIVAEAAPQAGSKFISATFCNNLERICACTETGSLHFFPLQWNKEGSQNPSPVYSQPSTSQSAPLDFTATYSELLLNGPLGIADLRQLLELTLSENLTPCYAATVPPCWSEIMQAQKQRKHPQHLQQGDDAQHTRTWRLQRDVTTWDEHVFEITLPKSCTIGHVCFKFSFQSTCSPPPNIEVTLLKQNVSGIGHKQPAGMPVDGKVDFGLGPKESSGNPVMSEEYLRAHNAEILCGPVNLSQYLDLSEQGGSLTLTSPKLMHTRSRTLQLHLKAVSVDLQAHLPRSNEEKIPKKSNTASSSANGSSSSCPSSKQPFFISATSMFASTSKKLDPVIATTPKKPENFLGCDWLQEVSVAIRRTKQTSLSHERNQRLAMLDSNTFIKRLLGVVCLEGPDKTQPAQGLALDILSWVVSVRLSPHCSGGQGIGDARLLQQQLEVGRIIKSHIMELIHHCFILGGRSIAHKCLKFILVCIKGVQSLNEGEGLALEKTVLDSLMDWLPTIGATKSAGALRWFLLLLMRVSPLDGDGVIGRECVFLLTLVAGELSNRTNPYHLLLRSRFGLYGTPFDPELFDVDPPVSGKSTSVPLTYASVVQGDTSMNTTSTSGASAFGGDTLDLRELLAAPASEKCIASKLDQATSSLSVGSNNSSSSSGTHRLKGLASNHYMKGLLEVEPLHYTCHAASDGTKLEKIEPGCGCTIPVSNFITLGTSGTKKAADGDFVKPLGMLIQEGESSSTSSQQSSTNSSPWLPQYAANEKMPSPLSSQPQGAAHSKPDCDSKNAFEEDHEMPSCSTKVPDSKKTEDLSTLNVPWQQLLVPPPQQTVVIERMHSGARRFVVLDFGSPVMLTDMIVPACCDLVLLSVDVWLCSEEQDGQRLVVASDIATKALVLSDLQPPPICRYLKITTIGRYGMTTTKCKIPIGSFFGHTMILPGESGPSSSQIPLLSESNLQAQISVLGSLLEDIHCRYALACSRLRELLSPLLQSETPNAAHMYCYLQRARDMDRQMNFNLDTSNQKVFSAYQECITFQHQLNVVRSVMSRLETACNPGRERLSQDSNCHQYFVKASTDKLRVLGEGLLDVLLYLGSLPLYTFSSPELSCLDRSVCENLFYWLCVGQDTRMQLASATLLVRLCGSQPWWGQFLAETVANLFSSNNSAVFPQDRVFIILAYLGRKSLTLPSARLPVMEAVLGMLGNLLGPLCSGNENQPLRSNTDISLVGWALLFVSQCLDIGSVSRDDENSDKSVNKDQGQQNRWDFIQGEVAMQRKVAAGGSRSRANILRTKRILVKQQYGAMSDALDAYKKQQFSTYDMSDVKFHETFTSKPKLKPQEVYLKKVFKHPTSHMKDTSGLRVVDGSKRGWAGVTRRNLASTSCVGEPDCNSDYRESAMSLSLPQAQCLQVARGLVALILHMDFTCNIDMFLLACKVLARIVWCSKPALPLSDLMTNDQLLKLIRMGVWQDPHQSSWGGPWAAHAITCLLQDILDGVRSTSVLLSRESSPADDANDSRPSTSNTQKTLYEKLRGHSSGLGTVAVPAVPPSPSTSTADLPSPPPGPSVASTSAVNDEDDTVIEMIEHPTIPPFPAPPPKNAFPMKAKPTSSWANAVAGSSSFAELLDYIADSGQSLVGTEEMVAEDCPDAAVSQPGTSGAGKGNGMVALESDDSELDDFLDDILEQGRSMLRKGSSSRTSMVASSKVGCISTAMDARLDFAVDCHAEVHIRRLTMLGAYNLPHSVNTVFPSIPEGEKPPAAPTAWPQPENEPESSHNMLIACFDKIFCELQLQGSWTSLEQVFQLWLTLNSESSFDSGVHHFDPSSCPTIGLSPEAISSLLSALMCQPEMSVRTWCLAFQCLTQVSNTSCSDAVARWGPRASQGMTHIISNDPQFGPVLLRFLAGSGLSSQNTDVGPTVCGAMRDLLVRLMVRTDAHPARRTSKWMSNQLLELANQLIMPGGAISGRRGPLDAQFAFFNLLLGFNFHISGINANVTMSYLESVGILVHTFIMTSEKVRRRSVTETNQSSSMCFGGLLSHVIGAEAKSVKGSTWDNILCSVLKLACSIVQSPLKTDGASAESMDTASSGSSPADMCQTDEHKAKTMGSASAAPQTPPRVPCIADTLLQHQLTMARLLSALAGCVGSPLAVLLGTSGERDANEPRALSTALSGEPISVGDGIFHLLYLLCKKVSQPTLLLRPIHDFLISVRDGSTAVHGQSSGIMQLSEPLLWFIMKALDSPENLKIFNNMGGTKVICENLLHCSQKLISSHPSLVSVVMQHLSRVAPPQPNVSKKVPSPHESFEGLQNFAPLGTISSSSATAQPADVLIQSFPSHRRARTPAWSYHFYPDELYMDLTLKLPCAVLLKEIQLQPHLTSLATCPSAVGLEVSKDGTSPLVPLCSPLPTSGMTFVRLTLDRPEVVTSVLLRLYRPHDSASIGLSQVRLLGSTTFGETAYRTQNWDVPEEEHLTKTSLGWLRLLHHCLVVAKKISDLQESVVASAAGLTGLLDACAGLLLIPAPAPPLLTTALEHVLLRLGLHSRELGLKLMQDLLRSSLHSQLSMSPPMGADSVVDLLFLLGTEQDEHSTARVETMLSWLQETASAALEPPPGSSKNVSCCTSDIPASAACIHSVAAVLWRLHSCGAGYDLSALFPPQLFNNIYHWTLLLPVKSGVKSALDAVLCSMCYIQPDLFPALLRTIGAVAPGNNVNQDTQTMDEDQGAMTDDRKQLDAWSSSTQLSEGQLMTIAMVSQSPPAVKHLLESGLLSFLSTSLLEFCFYEQDQEQENLLGAHSSILTDADKVLSDYDEDHSLFSVTTMASILKLFAELCYEGQLRNWFGSSEGSVFWLPLLRLLCYRSSKQTSGLQPQSQAFGELETATIQFLSRVSSLHPENQEQLARVLCDVISQQEARQHNVSFLHGISGFARRLVLQLLLESEKIRVLVNSEVPLQRPDGVGNAVGLRHPSHGVGHRSQVVIISHYTTCAELVKLVVGNDTLGPLLGERLPSDVSGTAAGPSSAATKAGMRHFKDIEYLCFADPLFAAGLTAKDKRSKEAKNAATRGPYAKKTRISDSSGGNSLSASLGLAPERWLEQSQIQVGAPLPGCTTLGQVLMALHERGASLCSASFEVTVKQSPSLPKEHPASSPLHTVVTFPTPLEVFARHGGLALLAEHLPLVYPETLRYSTQDKPAPTASSPDAMDADWVKVDGTHIDLYEELDDSSLLVGSSSGPSGQRAPSTSLVPTSVPPHSLAAFGLFLRLPGYAEILLRDPKKAQCLLRLALGVSDDGEGADILGLPLATSLPTLPFNILRQLLDGAALHTDDGELLRRTAMDTGAIHLLLACLSVFTHQAQDIHLPGVQHELVIAATKASTAGPGSGKESKTTSKVDDKSQLYWAKGTGFGTGSTAQCWNVEQALMRQRSEEEHVTVLLQATSSFLNPRDVIPQRFHEPLSDSDSDSHDAAASRMPHLGLPPQLPQLLQKSCLLPAVCSYLRNDSVLDMARHIPLYRAVLQVLRSLAVSPQLAALLLPSDRRRLERQDRPARNANSSRSPSGDALSATCLLNKMKSCVDTYASRLRLNRSKGAGTGRKSGGSGGSAGSGASAGSAGASTSRMSSKFAEDWEQDEGLAQLIADIRHTASMVTIATDRLVPDEDPETSSRSPTSAGSCVMEYPMKRSLEERYLEVMQKLQFDTFEMVTENTETGGYQFAVSYHFESNLRSAGDRCHPARVKRLAQETVTLSTSLPLSYSSSVYVRCDSDRLDIMKVLITGPADTPYANGCFEFDVYFPPDYPNSPMLINMETTGHHTIRFNPNLYNDGKVCLSVLNTWHGRPEEKWNAQTSSFLQVLVSIQSLILVPEPYFNEPGYERSRGTPSGNQSSREYNANICTASVKWAMLEQVRNPCPCFKEVIHTHFWFKRREVIKQIEGWIAEMEGQGSDRRNGRTISLNTIALKRHLEQLREELNKLKPPPGQEDLVEQTDAEDEPISVNSTSSGATSSSTANVPIVPLIGPSASIPAGPSEPSEPFEPSDADTDMEMEKLVSKVCE